MKQRRMHDDDQCDCDDVIYFLCFCLCMSSLVEELLVEYMKEAGQAALR